MQANFRCESSDFGLLQKITCTSVAPDVSRRISKEGTLGSMGHSTGLVAVTTHPRSPLPKKIGDATPGDGSTCCDPLPFILDHVTPSISAGLSAPSGTFVGSDPAAASGMARSTLPRTGTIIRSASTV